MADIPVVHLPALDYADDAIKRDWRKTGYAVTAEFAGHPVREACPQCSAAPVEIAPPRDEMLESLLAELDCLVHPAGEAEARAVAWRIFRYGVTAGWDKAVAAAGPGDSLLPSADAMRDPGHG